MRCELDASVPYFGTKSDCTLIGTNRTRIFILHTMDERAKF